MLNMGKDRISTEDSQQREESIKQAESQLKTPSKDDYGSLIYDKQILDNTLNNSSLFRRLRPEFRQQFLGEQRNYTFLRKFAILHLQQKLWHKINCWFNINQYHKQSDEHNFYITQEIFSWSIEEFLKRRCLHNFIWIDVMLKSSRTSLEMFKFRKDLEELQRYVECIFEGLLSNIDDPTNDNTKHALQAIGNIKHVLQYCNNLEQELLDNKKKRKEMEQTDSPANIIKRESDELFTVLYLKQRIIRHHIVSNIESRFLFGCFQANINRKEHDKTTSEVRLLNDILNYNHKLEREKECGNNCMDHYYATIANLKLNITKVQSIIDEVAERVENMLNIKRTRLKILSDTRNIFTKELIRFRQEIEAKRIKEEKRASKRELRLREEQEQKMKSKKGKKGKKGKAGTGIKIETKEIKL